jgi:predicted outer membrane protein
MPADRARICARCGQASNGELKGLLQTGLKIFQGHQQHAEHVASDLK